MTIQVTGLIEARKRTEKLRQEKPAAFARGLMKGGLFLQAKAQQLTPVDTGALKSSAYTKLNGEIVDNTGQNMWGKIKGFFSKLAGNVTTIDVEVGFTQKYAAVVHERLDVHHPVGQAKYLEQPARMYQQQITQIVIEETLKG